MYMCSPSDTESKLMSDSFKAVLRYLAQKLKYHIDDCIMGSYF